MRHRRRAWCETVPCEDLAAPRALGMLRRFAIAPIIAAWPETDVAALARVLAVFADAGLPAAVWPMLADRDGRWANATNAGDFARFTASLLEGLARLGAPIAEVAIDLEPSIEAVRRASAHFSPIAIDRRAFSSAEHRLRSLGDAIRARGALVSAAVPPTVILDPEGEGPRPYQEILGTPVDGLRWDHVSVMIYTSILEGWSKRVLRREDARAFLALAAKATAARFGDRAGVSLGAVGTGAFGDEPIYRAPDELADDVAIAAASGVDDLTLFDLGGVLRRPHPEAWLEAFTRTPPALRVPDPSPRLRVVLAGARLAGGVIGVLGRLGRR